MQGLPCTPLMEACLAQILSRHYKRQPGERRLPCPPQSSSVALVATDLACRCNFPARAVPKLLFLFRAPSAIYSDETWF